MCTVCLNFLKLEKVIQVSFAGFYAEKHQSNFGPHKYHHTITDNVYLVLEILGHRNVNELLCLVLEVLGHKNFNALPLMMHVWCSKFQASLHASALRPILNYTHVQLFTQLS